MEFIVARHIQFPHLIMKQHAGWDLIYDLSDRHWSDSTEPQTFEGVNFKRAAFDVEGDVYKAIRGSYQGACRTFDNMTHWLTRGSNSSDYTKRYQDSLKNLADRGMTDFPSVGQQRNYWKDIGNTIEVVKFRIDLMTCTLKEIERIGLKQFGPKKISPIKRKWISPIKSKWE